MAIFGYEEPQEKMPVFGIEKKPKKKEGNVKDIQLKFNFSETESEMDDDISQNPRDNEINNDYGRQTIDLNGPIYDPSLLPSKNNGCMSELCHEESEADDVNRILDQMDSQSFRGFGNSDLDNSLADQLNDGRMVRQRRQNKSGMNDIFI